MNRYPQTPQVHGADGWLLDEELDKMIDEALSTVDDGRRASTGRYTHLDLCPNLMCCSDRLAVQPYVEWPILTYYQEGIPALVPGGFDLYFRNCKVFVDKK